MVEPVGYGFEDFGLVAEEGWWVEKMLVGSCRGVSWRYAFSAECLIPHPSLLFMEYFVSRRGEGCLALVFEDSVRGGLDAFGLGAVDFHDGFDVADVEFVWACRV